MRVPFVSVAFHAAEQEHEFEWMQGAEALVEMYYLDYCEADLNGKMSNTILFQGVLLERYIALRYKNMSLTVHLLLLDLLLCADDG